MCPKGYSGHVCANRVRLDDVRNYLVERKFQICNFVNCENGEHFEKDFMIKETLKISD